MFEKNLCRKIFEIFLPFRTNRDEYIKDTMRDNMQLLVNALWQVNKYLDRFLKEKCSYFYLDAH